MTLDVKLGREGPPPRDAATLIVLRDHLGPSGEVEIFCVERNKKSRFLGGAIVFPGGKLDEDDRDPRWRGCTTMPRASTLAGDEETLRALGVTACREALEEAAILPVAGGALAHEELLTLRAACASEEACPSLFAFLMERRLSLDLAALHPFARWLTPEAESRRYDTRFFLAAAPPGQVGAHDDLETMSSFWATPHDLLARFDAGEVQLAPPTHRTAEVLAGVTSVAEAFALAERACKDIICPRLVPHRDATGDTMALVLPGDPEHEVKEARVAGFSRFVLRDGRWCPEAFER